jgi:uncharacterized protein
MMLHYYRFKNFQSFRDEAEISLVLSKRGADLGWEMASPSGSRLSLAMAILGANGAGKTAALKPLAFAQWFMRASFSAKPDAPILFIPHFAAEDQPTEIEIVVEDSEGVIWKYVLHATRQRVIHEALYRKHVGYKYVFVRDWDSASSSYLVKQNKFGLKPAEALKVRQNASLISTALQYDIDLAKQVALSFVVLTNVSFMGRNPFEHAMLQEAAEALAGDSEIKERVAELLTSWDLGLADIQIEEVEALSEDGKPERIWMPFGTHVGRDGKTYKIPMQEESSGTQSAFVLLPPLLTALAIGAVASIDELENDLHPHMIEPILSLFATATTNPRGAQLIFTCHTTEVLNLLQKSQIAFVEKNSCESELYRADEIQGLRSDDNLRAKYLAGALGAVPRI